MGRKLQDTFDIIRLLAYEDGTEFSETSAYEIQTPGNYPEENIQHTVHGGSFKSSRLPYLLLSFHVSNESE
jgi:hypothetical protein